MITTSIILLVAVGLFIWGKLRSDIVALLAMLALLVSQILTPEEALSGFSNSTVIMMAGLFIVGGGIFQTGLAKMISSKILKLAGKSETRLFLLVMLATSFIGAFVSNTGTVALMLPIVVSLARNAGMNPSRLLMPLAFASSIGGMLTLIGTPPNMIIHDTLVSNGYQGLKFFTFLPVGIVTMIVGIGVLMPLTKIFLSKKGEKTEGARSKSLGQLVKEYGLAENLFRVKIDDNSSSNGKSIVELDIRNKYGLNVLEIRRESGTKFFKTASTQTIAPQTVLQSGDILYLSGEISGVNRFVGECGAIFMDAEQAESSTVAPTKLAFYNIGIAEILMMSTSALVGKSVKEIGFREKYNVNVLGIRRRKDYLLSDIWQVKVLEGDVLLVQGAWEDINRLSSEENEWVVLGQPMEAASKVTMDHKAPIAAAIMVVMVAMMAFDFIPIAPVTAVTIAAVLMILTGCLRGVEAAYKTINWQTIVLFAAMLPMSIALEKTGASGLISGTLVSALGGHGPMLLLAGIYFTTSLMTMFLSNTVTAVLMAQIALQAAVAIDLNPVPFLFAVSVGASMCFASPFSTPPNALVMPAGQYTFMDFIKVGLPLQLIMGIVMVFVLPLIFPF